MADSIANIGLKGMLSGLSSAAEHATNIASRSEDLGATVEDAVGLKLAEHQVKASAKVIKVSEGLDRAVLDILA